MEKYFYKDFNGAFNDASYASNYTAKRGASPIPRRHSKISTLDEVMDVIEDGDVISYPHYYRTGDKGLELVVQKLRQYGKKNICLYANAIFDHTEPWLQNAFRDGVLTSFYGNPYRKFGAFLMNGGLDQPSVGFSHGNRVRKLQTGEIKVKVAFGPVPMADIHGNASGCLGDSKHWCGPLGLFLADAEYADYVCLLTGDVSDRLLIPASISMELVDFVVPVDCPGLAEGIGSGTLNIEKARSNPFNAKIAENVTKVMHAAEVIQDGFNFQVGSGAGLVVLDNIRQELRSRKIQANYAIGGITSLHVDMYKEGLIDSLMHGQLFEASDKVVSSLYNDAKHVEISTGYYASVAGKEAAVNMLDVAVLSALELDLEFNVNTVCANGRIIGGIGGGQDVAAGADLTIMFLPLATGKNGKGFPKVVEKVYTKTTPGEVIDVVVTEDYVVVNPNSKSTKKNILIERAKEFGLNIIDIETLHDFSIKKAKEFGVLPILTEVTDRVIHYIEWRDGTLLDKIYQPFVK
ncbi:MAG: citrate lyase subunit alpha [Bacteroidales bacterium]